MIRRDDFPHDAFYARRLQLVQVGCLMGRGHHALSAFEAETVLDVRARVKADAEAIAAVTAAEWRVIEDALAAMRSAGSDGRAAA